MATIEYKSLSYFCDKCGLKVSMQPGLSNKELHKYLGVKCGNCGSICITQNDMDQLIIARAAYDIVNKLLGALASGDVEKTIIKIQTGKDGPTVDLVK